MSSRAASQRSRNKTTVDSQAQQSLASYWTAGFARELASVCGHTSLKNNMEGAQTAILPETLGPWGLSRSQFLNTVCPEITHAKCSRTPLMSSASERSTRHSRKASMLRARSAAGTVEVAYAE